MGQQSPQFNSNPLAIHDVRIRPESPLHSDTIAVIAGNLIPIVGVVAAGWQPETLLLVYLAELATICLWAAVQTLFARKRPNNFLRRAVNDSRRRFELLGPLQQKRGGTRIAGPLPPVYLRNVPTFIAALVVGPLVVGLGFVLVAFTRPTITQSVATSFLLGGTSVGIGRSVAIWHQFFSNGGYEDHSARSVLLTPFRYLLVLGVLFLLFLSLESGPIGGQLVDPRAAVVGLAVAKLGYDVRTIQLDRDSERRSWFARLYGGQDTEIDPEPVTTPASSPTARFSMDRSTAVADALRSGVRYVCWNSEVTVLLCLLIALGIIANSQGIVLATVGLAILLGGVRSVTRYLRYGTVEYHCYRDQLIAFDRLLDEPQSKMAVSAVAAVSIKHDRVDNYVGTETLEFEVTDPPEPPKMQLFVPKSTEVPTGDIANQSIPLTMYHVRDANAVLNCLGLSEAHGKQSITS